MAVARDEDVSTRLYSRPLRVSIRIHNSFLTQRQKSFSMARPININFIGEYCESDHHVEDGSFPASLSNTREESSLIVRLPSLIAKAVIVSR